MKLNERRRPIKIGRALVTALFAVISVAYVFPVFMVLINSFKENAHA